MEKHRELELPGWESYCPPTLYTKIADRKGEIADVLMLYKWDEWGVPKLLDTLCDAAANCTRSIPRKPSHEPLSGSLDDAVATLSQEMRQGLAHRDSSTLERATELLHVFDERLYSTQDHIPMVLMQMGRAPYTLLDELQARNSDNDSVMVEVIVGALKAEDPDLYGYRWAAQYEVPEPSKLEEGVQVLQSHTFTTHDSVPMSELHQNECTQVLNQIVPALHVKGGYQFLRDSTKETMTAHLVGLAYSLEVPSEEVDPFNRNYFFME